MHLFFQEADLKAIKEAKLQEKLRDREASLQRARDQAYLADGISWGMGEDAVEEDEVCVPYPVSTFQIDYIFENIEKIHHIELYLFGIVL